MAIEREPLVLADARTYVELLDNFDEVSRVFRTQIIKTHGTNAEFTGKIKQAIMKTPTNHQRYLPIVESFKLLTNNLE